MVYLVAAKLGQPARLVAGWPQAEVEAWIEYFKIEATNANR